MRLSAGKYKVSLKAFMLAETQWELIGLNVFAED